jgi:hypothetical protein
MLKGRQCRSTASEGRLPALKRGAMELGHLAAVPVSRNTVVENRNPEDVMFVKELESGKREGRGAP